MAIFFFRKLSYTQEKLLLILTLFIIFINVQAKSTVIDLNKVSMEKYLINFPFSREICLGSSFIQIENDCWEEIGRLADIIKVYKSMYLKVYYGEKIDLNELIKVITQIKNYKTYEWGFWCTATVTALFVDLSSFVENYPLR